MDFLSNQSNITIFTFILINLVGLAFFVKVIAIHWPKKDSNTESDSNLNYRVVDKFLSDAELSFYKVLLAAVPPGSVVFSKVRIADVLTPTEDNKSYMSAFAKISAKHFDFIICSEDRLAILAAVELDDRSHQSKKAKSRDAIVNKACSSAKLPLIRIKARASYNIQDIKKEVDINAEVVGASGS